MSILEQRVILDEGKKQIVIETYSNGMTFVDGVRPKTPKAPAKFPYER